MKRIKIIALLLTAMLSANLTFAATKTIYCKLAQEWWMVVGAAVGCHSWGTGAGTTWPGVRMTPVEGETDLWSIELDTDQVQNVIFTRVSPEGISLADWGAKTKNLQIPTDDKNLFTITTSSESWGDPGCDGEWSVYGGAVEKPKHDYTITVYLPAFCDDIAAYADSARVMGGFDDWSNGIWMEKKIDEDFNDCWYAEIYDVEEGTAFKLRFGTDADWKVQVQLNGANMANEAFGETTDIVLHYDGEGYGFAACAAPAARKEFVFIAGEIADANPALFSITWGKDGSNETVKLANKADDIYTAEILETVDSVVLVRCATGATEIIWGGEGMNVWNQTANYELCDTMSFGEWTEEGLFTLTCEAPQPVETKYYAKNNWNGAASEDWSWLEMSATNQENIYMLDSIVFGGTGVNINDKADDADALYFAADKIVVLDDLDGLPGPIPPKPRGRDTIPYAPARTVAPLEAPTLLAGDTIKLFFNAADSTLSAAIVGRPAQPEPAKTFDLTIEQDTVWTTSGGKVAAWIWGEELAGEWTDWATDNEGTLTLKVDERADSIIFKRFAPEVEVPYWDGTAEYQWNEIAKSEIADCHLFIITDWNEGAWCERPERPTTALPIINSKSLIQNSKLIKNGRLFIIREGRWYNVMGALAD